MENLKKSDGQWKRVQQTNKNRKFANRTAATRATPRRGFDSRKVVKPHPDFTVVSTASTYGDRGEGILVDSRVPVDAATVARFQV